MIPRDYITEWRTRAPWIEDFQVEQDLIISRALVEMFSNSVLAEALAFRGGTALYKLYLTPPARYSEEIDLIQVVPEAAGPVMDAMRSVLDPWLGEAQWKQSRGRVTFRYRFMSEDVAPMRLRLKIEINTRERFTVFGFAKRSFSVQSRWYSGVAHIKTFELDELMATKLRALYQRKKARDLFDVATGIADERCDPRRIVSAFREYMDRDGSPVTRAMFERNLMGKLGDPQFSAGMLVAEADMYIIEQHWYIWGPKVPQFGGTQPWVIGLTVISTSTAILPSVGGVDREALEHMLGLDVPVHVQYGRWIGVLPTPDWVTGESHFRGLLQGTLGESLMGAFTIEERIIDGLPVTIELGFIAIIIGLLISFPA